MLASQRSEPSSMRTSETPSDSSSVRSSARYARASSGVRRSGFGNDLDERDARPVVIDRARVRRRLSGRLRPRGWSCLCPLPDGRDGYACSGALHRRRIRASRRSPSGCRTGRSDSSSACPDRSSSSGGRSMRSDLRTERKRDPQRLLDRALVRNRQRARLARAHRDRPACSDRLRTSSGNRRTSSSSWPARRGTPTR